MNEKYQSLAEAFKEVLCFDNEGCNRFVMALTVVKEQGYLRAQECRQFAELGIPLMLELHQRLNLSTRTLHNLIQLGDVISYRDTVIALYGILERLQDISNYFCRSKT